MNVIRSICLVLTALFLLQCGGTPSVNDADLRFISHREVVAMLASDEDVVLVDCRPREFYRQAHIPGAINIPSAEIMAEDPRLADFDRIIVYDDRTLRLARGSAKAFKVAKYDGVRVYMEGLNDWAAHGGKLINHEGTEVDASGRPVNEDEAS